jgi:hypothetical protein
MKTPLKEVKLKDTALRHEQVPLKPERHKDQDSNIRLPKKAYMELTRKYGYVKLNQDNFQP